LKALLGLTRKPFEELSKTFSKVYEERLASDPMAQQRARYVGGE